MIFFLLIVAVILAAVPGMEFTPAFADNRTIPTGSFTDGRSQSNAGLFPIQHTGPLTNPYESLIIGNGDLDGENPQFIQTADDEGEVHAHIDFLLSEEAEFGAYGILFRLITDNEAFDPSQPVWLVFNYGLMSAIIVHFLYDLFIFIIEYIDRVIERRIYLRKRRKW